MTRIIHFECLGGASGDMCLGALVDLGVPVERLQEALDGLLGTGTIRLHRSSREEEGIRATRLQVEIGVQDHGHRHLGEILGLIGASPLPAEVREAAARVFRRLAEAEGKVHGLPPEQIHFHEVGALDAIADITGTCLGLHLLGVERASCGPLKTGRGTVRCAHGVLPLPAPAVLELAVGRTLEYLDLEGELTTPTGAALLTTLAEERRSLTLRPERVGHGCGERRFPGLPNLLRATLGTEPSPALGE